MIDKIIKLLGGFTREELSLVEREAESWVEASSKEIEYLHGQSEKKDLEIARLTNLMLTRAGFIIPEGKSDEPHHQPINTRKSWRQEQRELESKDAKRYADEIERRWKEKPGAVSEGTSGDGSLSEREIIDQG